MPEARDQLSIEDLYEQLAVTIDSVRGEMDGHAAQEIESQFLAKLALLAVREIPDETRRKELIRVASLDLG